MRVKFLCDRQFADGSIWRAGVVYPHCARPIARALKRAGVVEILGEDEDDGDTKLEPSEKHGTDTTPRKRSRRKKTTGDSGVGN